MKHFNLQGLSLNQIDIFLCAAESDSFNTAAQKLSYSQSMVSKTILNLEKSLGLILFLRGKSRNALTPAGKSLYADCKALFGQLEDAIEKAHVIQRGMLSSLSIGCVDTMIESPELEKIVEQFRRDYPHIALQYDEYSLEELMGLAKQSKLDIVVTAKHDVKTFEDAGYAWKLLFDTRLAVFVHKSNRLWERREISFSDLSQESFIILSPASNSNYFNLLISLCAQEGFVPNISTYVSNAHSFLMNLLSANGIVLADTFTNIRHRDIRMIPLPDYPAGVVIAWPKETPNPSVRKFLKAVESVLYSDP